MGSFVFENSFEQDVTVQIEPWAQAFDIKPRQRVTFTYADNPDNRIEFAYSGPGQAFIALMASEVVISGHGGPDLRYGFDESPAD